MTPDELNEWLRNNPIESMMGILLQKLNANDRLKLWVLLDGGDLLYDSVAEVVMSEHPHHFESAPTPLKIKVGYCSHDGGCVGDEGVRCDLAGRADSVCQIIQDLAKIQVSDQFWLDD